MKGLGWFTLVVFLILLALLPVVFGQLFTAALVKLQLSPRTALLVVIGIFAGSLINIPLKRIPRTEAVLSDPFAIFGLSHLKPSVRRMRRDTVIAVNVGGCMIPVTLAIYEAAQLLSADMHALKIATGIASIGGAGTFDGIVLSGIVAAYLA